MHGGIAPPLHSRDYIGNLSRGEFYSSRISRSSSKAEGNHEAVVSGGCLFPYEYPGRVHGLSSPQSYVTEEKGGILYFMVVMVALVM